MSVSVFRNEAMRRRWIRGSGKVNPKGQIMPNLPALRNALPIAAALTLGAAVAAMNAPYAFSQSSSQIVSGAQESSGDSVQIEADSMEVDQESRRATFSGNVDAVQGSVRMRSDTLTVDYEESDSQTDVTFLHARGNVVVDSKGQTVESQWARMDVRANTVLFGDRVTVRDGQSVLRGSQLELDLDTGESRLTGGRVQGTFFRSDD